MVPLQRSFASLSTLLLVGTLCLPHPCQGQGGTAVPLCWSYADWSVTEAHTALNDAVPERPPDCYGANWTAYRDLAHAHLDVAQAHLAQVFYGEAAYRARACLRCDVSYLVRLAATLDSWSQWLYANGYRNDHPLTLSLFQQWQGYPY